MKGKNTIKLNERAMLDAVQMWVDSAFTSRPRAVAVRQFAAQAGYAGQPPTPASYEIDVDDGEQDDAKQPSSPAAGERSK